MTCNFYIANKLQLHNLKDVIKMNILCIHWNMHCVLKLCNFLFLNSKFYFLFKYCLLIRVLLFFKYCLYGYLHGFINKNAKKNPFKYFWLHLVLVTPYFNNHLKMTLIDMVLSPSQTVWRNNVEYLRHITNLCITTRIEVVIKI